MVWWWDIIGMWIWDTLRSHPTRLAGSIWVEQIIEHMRYIEPNKTCHWNNQNGMICVWLFQYWNIVHSSKSKYIIIYPNIYKYIYTKFTKYIILYLSTYIIKDLEPMSPPTTTSWQESEPASCGPGPQSRGSRTRRGKSANYTGRILVFIPFGNLT
jgi:hypothetical protein